MIDVENEFKYDPTFEPPFQEIERLEPLLQSSQFSISNDPPMHLNGNLNGNSYQPRRSRESYRGSRSSYAPPLKTEEPEERREPVTSWVVVLLGTGCLVGALMTDFWSTHHPRHSIDNLRMHRGLFKQCITTVHQSTCQFRFTNFMERLNHYVEMGFTQRSMAYEQQPVQRFEITCVSLLLLAQALAAFVLICGPYFCSKWRKLSIWMTAIIGLLTGIGCLTYLKKNSEGETFTLRQTIYQDVFNSDFGSDINDLSWSFYLATLATVFFFAAVLLNGCSRPPVQYEVVSVV